jgi:hypothetical protein
MVKKDFKPGDKVTVVMDSVCEKGFVEFVYDPQHVNREEDIVRVRFRVGSWQDCHKCFVYHGHNVKAKITGEELPERLRVEERKQRTIEFLDVLKEKIRAAKDVNLNFKSSPDPDSVSFEISGMIYM